MICRRDSPWFLCLKLPLSDFSYTRWELNTEYFKVFYDFEHFLRVSRMTRGSEKMEWPLFVSSVCDQFIATNHKRFFNLSFCLQISNLEYIPLNFVRLQNAKHLAKLFFCSQSSSCWSCCVNITIEFLWTRASPSTRSYASSFINSLRVIIKIQFFIWNKSWWGEQNNR